MADFNLQQFAGEATQSLIAAGSSALDTWIASQGNGGAATRPGPQRPVVKDQSMAPGEGISELIRGLLAMGFVGYLILASIVGGLFAVGKAMFGGGRRR